VDEVEAAVWELLGVSAVAGHPQGVALT
jgi:hypothetical protein